MGSFRSCVPDAVGIVWVRIIVVASLAETGTVGDFSMMRANTAQAVNASLVCATIDNSTGFAESTDRALIADTG